MKKRRKLPRGARLTTPPARPDTAGDWRAQPRQQPWGAPTVYLHGIDETIPAECTSILDQDFFGRPQLRRPRIDMEPGNAELVELERLFRHHPPKSAELRAEYSSVRAACGRLAAKLRFIVGRALTTDTRVVGDFANALARLREVMFWTNAAIANARAPSENRRRARR